MDWQKKKKNIEYSDAEVFPRALEFLKPGFQDQRGKEKMGGLDSRTPPPPIPTCSFNQRSFVTFSVTYWASELYPSGEDIQISSSYPQPKCLWRKQHSTELKRKSWAASGNPPTISAPHISHQRFGPTAPRVSFWSLISFSLMRSPSPPLPSHKENSTFLSLPDGVKPCPSPSW